ncbi:MAG: NAD(+) synthase [Synergistales bacterium]|nr:NAD(+) synthase [Synergistales bacterium]
MNTEFSNLYSHGFVRVAACVPVVRVGDPAFNVEKSLELLRKAHGEKAVLAVFPELGISAYSCDDLFFQDAIQNTALEGLGRILDSSAEMSIAAVVGLPLKIRDALFNCAAVLFRGKILGIAVKSFLPNYREFYEMRHFKPSSDLPVDSLDILGQKDIPLGADLIFEADDIQDFRLFCEICEDLWTPVPPSCHAALHGATVIANPSASNVTIGKADYRRSLVSNQSARCIAAYVYAGAGPGESTTDLAWDGHAMVGENGEIQAESERFSRNSQVILADVDLGRLVKDRMTLTTFSGGSGRNGKCSFRRVRIPLEAPRGRIPLLRSVPRFPYVPSDPAVREERCREIFNIQVHGLAKRMESTDISSLVIGVSGGLDSTHALLVCARTMDLLGLPRTNIKAYSLPGFATSGRTASNAKKLMDELGVSGAEIDIRPGCMQMLKDMGHPFADGSPVYDVAFENVQAGQRTSLLFRIAGAEKAMVMGTGDLSELALGWCTYGVGDHMSHYNVNASLPKTLIQYLVRWAASGDLFGPGTSPVLNDILETEISPELVPGTGGEGPSQSTEAVIGPYELQDFTLFYALRYGYLPSKIAFLAWSAWRDRETGEWPDIPPEKRRQYTLQEIKHWLEVFVHRFYKISQYKRSCVPNGPKVGTGGSLSPRGDYRAPSDGESAPWEEDLRNIPGTDT